MADHVPRLCPMPCCGAPLTVKRYCTRCRTFIHYIRPGASPFWSARVRDTDA